MNRTELFNEVKSWLEAVEISFLADDEEPFRFRVNADNGLFDVRLQCEEDPAMLQVSCPLPVRVPPEKVPAVALLLHKVNAIRLRINKETIGVMGAMVCTCAHALSTCRPRKHRNSPP